MSSVVPVIILNWNGEPDTLACLRSIRDSGPRAGFVPVVVDNGSASDALERLKLGMRELFPRLLALRAADLADGNKGARHEWNALDDSSLVFIEAGENLGFAKGNNLGVQFAERLGAPWVMLLNNDTIVEPPAFQALRDFVRAHPDLPAVTPLILEAGPGAIIQSCGGDLTFFGSRIYRRAGQDAAAVPASGYSTISFITGCALLFRYGATGRLTEDYFYGEEDYEFSLRMRQRGLRMACVHGAVIRHKGGASINRSTTTPFGSILVTYVNRLSNTRRYYSAMRWQATRLLAYLRLPVLLMRNRIDPRKSIALIRLAEAHLRTSQGVDRAAFQSLIVKDA